MIQKLISRFRKRRTSASAPPRPWAPGTWQPGQVLQTKWIVPRDVQACQGDSALILLDIRQGKVYRADRIASQLWRSILEGVDLRGFVAQIASREDVDLEIVERDAEAFLADLAHKRLICASEVG